MARDIAGRWCCDCDYCGQSPCIGRVTSVFLTDHPQTHNYYAFCDAHAASAAAAVAAYLAAHPGVAREAEEE